MNVHACGERQRYNISNLTSSSPALLVRYCPGGVCPGNKSLAVSHLIQLASCVIYIGGIVAALPFQVPNEDLIHLDPCHTLELCIQSQIATLSGASKAS